MKNNNLTVVYLRCSSDQQSISHQLLSIENYCKQKGLTIDKIFKDEGISAYKKDVSARNGMLQVLELGRQGIISNLVIFETSRISRQYVESINIVDELTRMNVLIHSVSDGGIINQQEIDQLMMAFRSFMNNKASKEISIRTKSALNNLKQQGLHYGGGTPWGFVINERKLIPDETKTEEIVSFFEDYIAYGTSYCMDKYSCSRMTIINRIKNDKYIQIVGEYLYHKANDIRKERLLASDSNTKTLNRSDILYEGLLYHPCGHKLYIYRDNRTKDHRHFYRCTYCRGKDINLKKSFSGIKLDENIEKKILNILDNLDRNKLEEKYNNRCTKKKIVMELQLKNIQTQVNECNKAIEKANKRLQTFILEDKPDSIIETVTDLITNKKNELEQLEIELNKKQLELDNLNKVEKHQEQMINDILNAKEIYQSADSSHKKSILNLLIKKIVVRDINDFDIYLNI